MFVTISTNGREEVDLLIGRAIAAGATAAKRTRGEKIYGNAFEDMDGHIWEIIYRQPSMEKL